MIRKWSRVPIPVAAVLTFILLAVVSTFTVTGLQSDTQPSDAFQTASCPLPPMLDTGRGSEGTVPTSVPDIDRETGTQGKPLETATFALG
jgi:hypothetical protein